MLKARFSHLVTAFVLFALVLVLLSPLYVVHAATITVVNKNDSGPGSLRQAIADAAPGDSIDFAGNVRGTINIDSTLVINKDLTINGPGATLLRISGRNLVRVFEIVGGGLTINLNSLTITKGFASDVGAGLLNDFGSTVNINGCVFSKNTVSGGGGGGAILNYGSMSIANSLFFSNQINGAAGGAIYNSSNQDLTITASLFINNSATANAGAIFNNNGTLIVSTSTFSGNTTTGPSGGGAIWNSGNATATIAESTFSNNSSTTFGGAISNGWQTGATVLNLTGTTFTNNNSPKGGAVYNEGGIGLGTVNALGSTFSQNTASADQHGGGGVASDGGIVNVINSTFSSNNSTGGSIGDGGAIFSNGAALVVKSSTFTNNTAGLADGRGGALFLTGGGTTSVINSTFFGNTSVGEGGAIYDSAGSETIGVLNVTFSSKGANGSGGAIYSVDGTITLTNSLVVSSISGGNCAGFAITDGGNNLQYGDATCGGSITVSDPLLAPLANNGGPTLTMALSVGSPALDAGDNTACASAGTVNNLDQRGLGRPDGATCDIGAYEAQVNTTAMLTSVTPIYAGDPLTVDFVLRDLYRAAGGGLAAFDADCTIAPTSVLQGNSVIDGLLFGPNPLVINPGFQPAGQFGFAVSQTGVNPPVGVDGAVFTTSLLALAIGQSTPGCVLQAIDGTDVQVALPFQTIVINVISEPVTKGTISSVVLLSAATNASGTGITIKDGGNNTVASGNTLADGSVVITDVEEGSYTAIATTPGYLTAQGTLSVYAGQMTALQTDTLKAGDVNGDNTIDELDVVQFVTCYRKNVPPASVSCDFNRDNVVNVRDLLTITRGLTIPRQTGPQSWLED